MKYIIFPQEDGSAILRTQLLSSTSEAYLSEVVSPVLRSISDDEYINNFARILNTLARFSYILDREVIYWCIEWNPGLVVVKFAPDCSLAVAELHSPNPQFGGREATDKEIESYDENAVNHQYHLVFDAWDAQFDEEALKEWTIADRDTINRFDAALAHVQTLG